MKKPNYSYSYDTRTVEHPVAREHISKFLSDETDNCAPAERFEVTLPFGKLVVARKFMFEWNFSYTSIQISDQFDVQMFREDGTDYGPIISGLYNAEIIDDSRVFVQIYKETQMRASRKLVEERDI